MNIIAAVDENWGIGNKNKLLYRIPGDMKNFKRLTTGKIIVMGHTTLKSLPGSVCLPDRKNIILSRDRTLKIKNGIVCHSVPQVMDAVASDKTEDVFVIGGQTVYTQLLDYCNVAYITKIRAVREDADTFFCNLDEHTKWEKIHESEEYVYKGLRYTFNRYVKKP
jgi:dihydrofolate reductase